MVLTDSAVVDQQALGLRIVSDDLLRAVRGDGRFLPWMYDYYSRKSKSRNIGQV